MLYLSLEKNRIKLLSLKKSIMSQYEASFFDKLHQTDLLESGQVINVDFIASAVKEAVDSSTIHRREKDVYLILPQESFSFLRTSIPVDIATSALASFIKERAQSEWQANLDDYFFDYLIEKSGHQSTINLFAIEKTNLAKFQEAFNLIGQKIVNLLPETLAYFKLFEKTLRKEKLENIFYIIFENNQLSGYLYNSGGLLSPDKWQTTLPKETTLETVLKQQVTEFEKKGQKLSRLILSGQDSEKIRQDTFTKAINLWTNPLKRIISGFYQEYLKQLITLNHQPISILKYDVCLGAFIFVSENKQFSLLKKSSLMRLWPPKKITLPKLTIPLKEIVIFVVSFGLSFLTFLWISKSKLNFSSLTSLPKIAPLTKSVTPTPTSTPTPTPTPAFKKEDVKIKILNGSGTPGKAAEVKDILADKGYGEILTDNADNFDYETTILQVKKNRRQAISWIKTDLKNYLTDIKTESLEDDQAADVVLIIGQDFE